MDRSLRIRFVKIERIIKVMKDKEYQIFDTPYKTNIVGIRNNSKEVNKFNDDLALFYKNESDEWVFHLWNFTTKPGLKYMRKLLNPKGTAILVPGQYIECWSEGMHRKKHEALVQVKPVTVYRDKDLDDVHDYDVETDTGLFGINIHSANLNIILELIGGHSAGCQVTQDYNNHKNKLMKQVKKEKILYNKNYFSYTLLELDDLVKLQPEDIPTPIKVIGEE